MRMSRWAYLFFAFLFPIAALGQTEDVRSATGLPIPIGASVIYGQVNIRGLSPDEKKPSISVSLVVGGVIVERVQTNERGYYYFLRLPGDGTTLIFEVNDLEVGRVVLSGGVGSSTRRDVELDWRSIAPHGPTGPAVISIRTLYDRGAEANKLFEQAITAVKAKDPKAAAALFKRIVELDAKDFVSWTELGTLYFTDKKLDDAETAYKAAIAHKSDFLPALMNLGKLYFSQQKFELAATAFYGAVKANQTSADAFQYLGEAFLQMKQGSKAVVALNEALRLQPIDKAEIHLRLAQLYIAAGAKDRAANEYKIFLQKRPDYPEKSKLQSFIDENSKQ